MKKFIVITIVAMVGFVGLGQPVHAEQQVVNQVDINRLNTAGEKLEKFVKDFNNQSVSAATLTRSSAQLSVALDDVVKGHFNTGVGPEYDKASQDVQVSARKLKAVIDTLQSILAAKDEARYKQFAKDFNVAYKDYQSKVDAWNDAVTVSNQNRSNPYLWMLIVTGVVAAVVWAWALVKRDVRVVVQQAKKQVAIASLWPLAGAAITYITFIFAEQLGGSFYIAYGPVVFGLVLLIQAIINYVKTTKSAPKTSAV